MELDENNKPFIKYTKWQKAPLPEYELGEPAAESLKHLFRSIAVLLGFESSEWFYCVMLLSFAICIIYAILT